MDCELSQVERAHLNAHLEGCAGCTAFVAGLREVTHELRAAPLPAPSRPLLPPRRWWRAPGLLAGLAVVAAAVGGTVAGELRQSPPPASVHARGALLLAAFEQSHHLPGARLPQRTAI